MTRRGYVIGIKIMNFLNAVWYLQQKVRWRKLADKGFWFAEPPEINNFIGLKMKYADKENIVYVSREQSPEQIHTQILNLCEQVASISQETQL